MAGRMSSIEAIHIAPVKSLGLTQPGTVQVTPSGILEDRRLYLINRLGRLLTQREIGHLVQVKAYYQAEPEWLRLSLPGGGSLEGPLEVGEPVLTQIWGRNVEGRLVLGDWDIALSEYCREPVLLVRSDQPGQCYDEYPISLLSQGSLQELGKQSETTQSFDARRFRPNFLIFGLEPHEEDSWIGATIQIGEELRLQVVARDPRCAITTHDPDSGEPDIDTLRLILRYRPSSRAAYFGVYGTVEQPGRVSLNDPVVRV